LALQINVFLILHSEGWHPNRSWEPFVNLESRKPFVAHAPILFSTVVGLALRGIDREALQDGINLIGPDKGVKKLKIKPQPATEKMTDKISSPGAGHNRRRLFILLGVFIFLIAVFAGLWFWQRTRPGNTDFQTGLNTNGAAQGLALTVYTRAEDIENLPTGALAGRFITKKLSVTQEFKATGKKSVDKTTSGNITIVNNSSQNQSLVATTRFLTPSGVLFRLKTATTVIAGGSTVAEIYADNPDTLPEVQPTRLTIPGLSSTLQESIYGELKETIGGPAREASAVLDADIMQADLSMTKELTTVNAADLGDQVKSGEIIVPRPLSSKLVQSATSKKAGEIADTFTLTREFEVTILALSETAVKEKTGDESTGWRFIVREYNEAEGTIALTVAAQ
jgi:hypothetical protein